MTTIAILTALLLLPGCSREEIYGGQTLTQTIAQAYADCNESEIRFLASKQGIQTAFANCGSNRFAHMAWSPNGRWLYFQLTHGGHIMDGEDKTIITVPTELPVASAAWLRDDVLALPLGPAKGSANSHGRIVIFNRTANTLDDLSVPLSEQRDLQRVGEDTKLLLTGIDDSGTRKVIIVDTVTGESTPALPWLQEVDAADGRVVYAHDAGLVGVTDGAGGHLYKLDGTELLSVAGAKRVIPHPEGRYVALELDGAPVSPFDMRSWDELSETARERELARQEKWLEKQPDWVNKEVIPPEVQIVDLQDGKRYRVTSFWGDRFQWYEARNYYASFVLFGIEGKQLNANIGLTNLHERLRMLSKGESPLGMELMEDSPAAPAQTGVADPPTP